MACCLLGHYISEIDLNIFFSRDIRPISEEAIISMLDNHRDFIKNNLDDAEDFGKIGEIISKIMGKSL